MGQSAQTNRKETMNSSSFKQTSQTSAQLLRAFLLGGALLTLSTIGTLAQTTSGVFPPNSTRYGNDYGGWSAAWWTWFMQQPISANGIDHPGLDGNFDVTEGQSGDVWFLTAPFGTVVRNCTIPSGKALFVGLLNAECSNIEGLGDIAKQQRACAKATADFIDPNSLFCVIDGVPVANLPSYRTGSPQFSFVAPSPCWIFGSCEGGSGGTGGPGTSVANGYYVFLAPLAPGHHALHFGGSFPSFSFSMDMTYNITVQ
jgi:hypothetical protein